MKTGPSGKVGESESSAVEATRRDAQDLAGKYLTFFLGREEYGFEIGKVREIIAMMDITPVPRTPKFIRGVANLRGKVITIVDLRSKLGMEQRPQSDETCIIVVQIKGIETGVVVDRVSEVLAIAPEEIQEASSLGSHVNTDCILGMGKGDGRVRLLLDIDRVLSVPDVVRMDKLSARGKGGPEETRIVGAA